MVEHGPSPALEVEHLSKEFVGRAGFLGRHRTVVRPVNDVSFSIAEGETMGLVGESGSGKSTTARLALRLMEPTAGTIRLLGRDITGLGGQELRSARRDLQAVFQDITGAINSSMTVADIVAEPLRIHGDRSRADCRAEASEMLDRVGLRRDYLDRYPYELSGGQRQRVGIARALVLRPKVVVLDEPVSALDVSTQSQVINLLQDLQAELGTSCLFIAHNLYVVHHISEEIAVMYLGSIVERGPAEQVYSRPRHPYTQALLSAIPEPDPAAERRRQPVVLRGDAPGPTSIPPGCSFHTRCPHTMEICRHEPPETLTFPDGGTVACHLHTTGPTLQGDTVTGVQISDVRTAVTTS
ncbi:MAG: ABC transporter ATP-binding protein [Actinomycetota bacterium]|nr:ABC transporter ATP-binding protein [Actinomycetota bacterium]